MTAPLVLSPLAIKTKTDTPTIKTTKKTSFQTWENLTKPFYLMKLIFAIIAIVALSSCGKSNTQHYPIVNNTTDKPWELQHISTIPSDSSVYEVFYYTKGDSLMTYTAVNDTIVLVNKSKRQTL